TGVYTNAALSWTATAETTSYDIYLGTSATPEFVANVPSTTTSYTPALLTPNTQYFWSVVAKNAYGDAIDCSVQSFTTGQWPLYCTSSPTSNDGAGVSNVQIGTTNFPTGDVYYA